MALAILGEPIDAEAPFRMLLRGEPDRFFAINADGSLRWTYTSSLANAFTGTVPLLREDGVLLINEGSRKIIGIRTNGGKMSNQGWASFRHDGRRTKFTP